MVDPSRDVLYGPYPIQKNGTITVPVALLAELGMDKGHDAQWLLNPHLPGTLVLVPNRMVARIMGEVVRALGEVGN